MIVFHTKSKSDVYKCTCNVLNGYQVTGCSLVIILLRQFVAKKPNLAHVKSTVLIHVIAFLLKMCAIFFS